MTYLKYLFDKLRTNNYVDLSTLNKSGHSPSSQHQLSLLSNTSTSIVDATHLYDAFIRIKSHLPLLSREDYFLKHGAERGFTVSDVESSLKRMII
jgi:hypothetical protein